MARLLRRVESIIPRKADAFGGKARNLAMLARAGFPVPAAFAMSSDVSQAFFAQVLPESDRLLPLLSAPSGISPERLEDIAARVRAAPLPEEVEHALADAFVVLSREGARSLAVRSSSTREDQATASAAGLYASVLDVRTEAQLFDAVKTCFASVFSPRVLAYLTSGRASPETIAMGIIVQALVPAETSGVLFTINPLTGDGGEMVVNASYGLGSALVDGRVSPDTYRLEKSTGALRDRVIGEKKTRTVLGPQGVTEQPVPAEDRDRPALDEAVLHELVALGRRIEAHFEDARDVEWAAVGRTVYVLQARPVTATASHGPRSGPRRKNHAPDRSRIVWSNVNVGEALPGAATPLTWSVLSGFSELGFRRAFGALGCAVPRDAELVGNFRGRIYLNLSEFMEIASQVPGLNPRVLLSLGGGGGLEHLENEAHERHTKGFFARLPITCARFARENYRLGARVDAFEAFFEEERRRHGSLDLRLLSPAALDKTLSDAERLLDDSGAVMLTCYGNLLLSVVLLRTVLSIVAKDRAERLERDLLTGLADLESAAPGLALFHIAEMARVDDGARAAITDGELGALRIDTLPQGPTRRALENFVKAYGFRGAREGEIASPRWREDQALLFAALRMHFSRPPAERPLDIERRQRALRESAAAELSRLLPAPAAAAVRHLLALSQRFMRLRERLRAHVTEVLGIFRAVALDASRRFSLRNPEAGEGSAFFLTLPELHGALRGDLRSIAPLVRPRRVQYERDAALPDPPGTFVGYPPPVPLDVPASDAIFGLAASSGRAEGLARVVTSPAEALELRAGEILVAAYADVGWSPLFLHAGALVTDLGGPLSHAAIVAREYGLPTVVNVKVGTRTIRTGDRVVVDGDEGSVRILARAEPT